MKMQTINILDIVATSTDLLWQRAGQSLIKALARVQITFHKASFFTESEAEVLSPGKDFSFHTRIWYQTSGGREKKGQGLRASPLVS